MREQFDKEISKAQNIEKYNKKLAHRLYDDLATAFISGSSYGHLDESLISVKVAKKALRSSGYSQEFIDDYFLQRSYLSKTVLRKLKHEALYINDTLTITPHIENIQDREDKVKVTDLIIEKLESNTKLLKALQHGVSEAYLRQGLKVKNATLLINFYNQHKSIIATN